MEDLAFLTGAKLINEELGDDLDLIEPSVLGEAVKAVTDNKSTVMQVYDKGEELEDRITHVKEQIKDEKNGFFKMKLEQRLATLAGTVGIVRVGADSKVELKEKKDRVEDAVHATKAALKEGIVAGGGVALLNAANNIKPKNKGEELLLEAIKAPYKTILDNAGLDFQDLNKKGWGIDVVTGKPVNMVKAGIIDPVLVTKAALKNAVSVVNTIVSADCIISNKRLDDASN
jgi:chaperonin GroEL